MVWEESNKGIVLSLPWSRKVSQTLPYGKTPQPSGPHFLCWGNISLSCGRIPISQEAPALRIGEEGYSPLTISYWQLVFQHCGKWDTHPSMQSKIWASLYSRAFPSEVPHLWIQPTMDHTVPWSVFTGKKKKPHHQWTHADTWVHTHVAQGPTIN